VVTKAQLLHPDNFTPVKRTPWGGDKILKRYKEKLGLAWDGVCVGESWEISIEPSFPSRLVGSGESLGDAIDADPDGWLGTEVATRYGGQTPLLVKLLDAGDNLSVQVHPEDGDQQLAPGESGKPEGWVILEADSGCGLYLGFKPGIGPDEVRRCIEARGALESLMNFVPVSPGDAFYIDAGTPHAIGKGVTLLEPQVVTPGCRGITYRFWDWNRTYTPEGVQAPQGQPRELHLERSLQVTRFQPEGAASTVDTARCEPLVLSQEEWEFERAVVIECPTFITESWTGSGQRTFEPFRTMLTLTCVQGRARLEGECGGINLLKGQSAVVPAAEGAFTLYLYRGQVFSCRSSI
jgi:mannose-6-phosphate isomerase